MERIIKFCLFTTALTALAGFAWGQTTVPNTFTAGTPARAAEVNANFQALASAIDGLGGTSQTLVSGYDQSFGTSAALADRNVNLYR